MARKGGFDDDDMPAKKKGGGTASFDVSKLDLDEPGGRAGKGGWGHGRSDDEPRKPGRSASLGRGGRGGADDDDDDRGSARKGGGFGKSSGTAAFDVSRLDQDEPRSSKAEKAGWAKGGSKKHDLDDDDDSPAGRRRPVGSRRDSALAMGADDAEVVSPTTDWGSVKPAGDRSGSDEAPASLLVKEPGKEDRTVPLKTKHRSYTVGREVSCDVVLSDIKASRQHFEINFLAGAFNLKDLGSGNGTKVNGEKVSRIQLTNGAVIAVGDCQLVFQLDQAALDRENARDLPRRAKRKNEEEEEEEEEEQAPVKTSMLGILLIVLLVAGTFLFTGVVAIYLIFREPAKKPQGSKVVELEELPKEDPSLLAAQKVTAAAILGNAENYNSMGRAWESLRLSRVALVVDPGLDSAKSMASQAENTIKSQNSQACKVELSPANPRRGQNVTIRLRLNGAVNRVTGSFLDTELDFGPDPAEEGTWTFTFKAPPRGPTGNQPLAITIHDLLDSKMELQQEVPVKM